MKSKTHAIIISGGSSKLRRETIEQMLGQWNIAPYDIVVPDSIETSIGIADIRNFSSALQLSPRASDYSVGVIYDGQLLTTPAQQALLKTLEEPPVRSRIIMAVPSSALLLPTVLSRCQIIQLEDVIPYTREVLADCAKQFDQVHSLSLGERIKWCAGVGKTKEELSEFITKALYALRQKYIAQSTNAHINPAQIKLLHDMVRASRYMSTNVNISLVFERIMITRGHQNIV